VIAFKCQFDHVLIQLKSLPDDMTRHEQVFRVGSTYNGGPYGIPSGDPTYTWGNSQTAKGVVVLDTYHYHYLDHGKAGGGDQMRHISTIAWLLAALIGDIKGAAGAAGQMPALVAGAENIVVGHIVSGEYAGQHYRLTIAVDRVLKGQLAPGAQISVGHTANDRGTLLDGTIEKEEGMFFLRQDGLERTIISVQSGGTGLRSTYFAATRTLAAGVDSVATASPTDRVIRELAGTAQPGCAPQCFVQFVSKVSAADSQFAAAAFRQWKASPLPMIRAFGLAGLIAAGDADAVVRFIAELPTMMATESGEFAGSALSGFRGDNPAAIRAIGSVVTSTVATEGVRNSAVSALAEIHSKECLPFLYAMLSDADPLTRSHAVKGFSGFVLNIRINRGGTDGMEALDEALNPGRAVMPRSRYDTPEIRKVVHFGPFENQQEEETVLRAWKLWFEQSRSGMGL
jgi:hypothetical protein